MKRPCNRPSRPADASVLCGDTRGIGESMATTRDEESAMTPPHDTPKLGTREHFLQVSQLQRWGTIQEYVDLCRTQGYFTPAFYRKATAHMERIHVRRMLRQVTDGRGWPVLANIVRVDLNGRPERVFMQEELFGPEEYRQ